MACPRRAISAISSTSARMRRARVAISSPSGVITTRVRDRSTSCTPSSSSSFDSCADSVGWVTLRPFGRAPEMQRLGDECDVSELLKTGHRRPLIDIIYQNSLNIRLDQSVWQPYLSAT
jgi:hypothetical protein